MARERISIDLDDLRRRYEAGAGTPALAKHFGVSIATIAKRLTKAGVPLRNLKQAGAVQRVEIDVDDLRARFDRGESVLAISKALGISRMTINRRMDEIGLKARSGTEANIIRMSRMDDSARRRLTATANRARRKDSAVTATVGRDPRRERPTVSSAFSRSRLVGKGEAELFDLLVGRGLPIETQVPVYGYNLDITIGSVAVEVWWGKSYPMRRARHARRTVQLADLGWSTLFVWMGLELPTEATADAVVAFFEETGRRPDSVRPEYRVIRCDGEVVAGGEANLDNIPLEPTSSDGTY